LFKNHQKSSKKKNHKKIANCQHLPIAPSLFLTCLIGFAADEFHKDTMCEGDLRQQDQTRDLRENLRHICDKIVGTHLKGKPQGTL
jgi:hypothetical protein